MLRYCFIIQHVKLKLFVCVNKHYVSEAYMGVKVHSCQQKSMGLKFSKSQTGNDVLYSCHHNSSRFTFPIFAHSCRFSVLSTQQALLKVSYDFHIAGNGLYAMLVTTLKDSKSSKHISILYQL